ncbi:hypothetical protein ACLKA6_019633 [Drosophila palustris]
MAKFMKRSDAYAPTSSKKQMLDALISEMVAEDVLPFSFVEGLGFLNLIIPTTLGLMIKLDSALPGMKTTVGVEICNFLQTRLRARLAPYETRTGTRLATMLDPRFKKEGFREQSNAEQAAKILETEVASVLQNVQIEKENASDLYSFMTTKVKQKPKTIRSDAIIELRQYFEQQNASREADPLEYWKSIGAAPILLLNNRPDILDLVASDPQGR